MAADILSLRALNRATLHRQHLLQRTGVPALALIAQLVGLQAQEPPDPHIALWSRIEGFVPDELNRLLEEHAVVRLALMRGTIHLVTGDDALVLRPIMQPVLNAEIRRHAEFAPLLAGVDLEPVLAFATELLSKTPLTPAKLRAALAERFPDLHAPALAYACRCHLPLVQVPPRGMWRRSAGVTLATAESWLGRPLARNASIDDVVLRYLAAFGPATVADVASWSRLTGLRAVLERLRPRLRVSADERGRELFDVPEAARPDPDTPAPARFLPVYDNVLLSHADRSRFIDEEIRERLWADIRKIRGSVLHDGMAVGAWRTELTDRSVSLVVDHVPALSRAARADIDTEGHALLDVLSDADGRDHRDVRFENLG
jgi:hypothetical protein